MSKFQNGIFIRSKMVSKERYYVYRDFSQHSQMNTNVTMLGLMPKEVIKKLTLDQVIWLGWDLNVENIKT